VNADAGVDLARKLSRGKLAAWVLSAFRAEIAKGREAVRGRPRSGQGMARRPAECYLGHDGVGSRDCEGRWSMDTSGAVLRDSGRVHLPRHGWHR